MALSCSLKDLNLLQEFFLLVGRYFVDWKMCFTSIGRKHQCTSTSARGINVEGLTKMKPDSFLSQFQAVLTTYYEDIKEVQGASGCTKAKSVKRRFQDVDEAGDAAAAAAAPAADAGVSCLRRLRAGSRGRRRRRRRGRRGRRHPGRGPCPHTGGGSTCGSGPSPAGKPAGKGRSRAPKG